MRVFFTLAFAAAVLAFCAALFVLRGCQTEEIPESSPIDAAGEVTPGIPQQTSDDTDMVSRDREPSHPPPAPETSVHRGFAANSGVLPSAAGRHRHGRRGTRNSSAERDRCRTGGRERSRSSLPSVCRSLWRGQRPSRRCRMCGIREDHPSPFAERRGAGERLCRHRRWKNTDRRIASSF